MRPAVILLTFNSKDTVSATLERARLVASELFVVDSFSTDGTIELARANGAAVVQHPFEHYGAQRNWAIDNLPITAKWQLHLDSDEWMDDMLVQSILGLADDPEDSGYFLARYVRFLGRVMRHGGMSPTWHLRLFATGCGRCEVRHYDQHFMLLRGTTSRLRGEMIDDIRISLSDWTVRHNRWADGEVEEQCSKDTCDRIQPKAFGSPTERKRFLRERYNGMPLFVRPFGLFIYRYFVRLGILDGTEGLIFWLLQSFWFRFLVDAKLWERRHAERLASSSPKHK